MLEFIRQEVADVTYRGNSGCCVPSSSRKSPSSWRIRKWTHLSLGEGVMNNTLLVNPYIAWGRGGYNDHSQFWRRLVHHVTPSFHQSWRSEWCGRKRPSETVRRSSLLLLLQELSLDKIVCLGKNGKIPATSLRRGRDRELLLLSRGSLRRYHGSRWPVSPTPRGDLVFNDRPDRCERISRN